MSPLTMAPLVAPTEGSLFYTVLGLPLHPLAVHAAVVLLPLSAAALLALVARPGWRSKYGAITLVGLLVGTGAAFVAKESGEALAAKIGLPADHARWGDVLPLAALVLLAVGGLWIRRTRSGAATGSGSTTVLAGLSAAASVAVLALSALTGHSGAEAVWSGRLPDSAARSTSSGSYSLAQVGEHNTTASCWSAIGSSVYDLTTWISRHPGGSREIEQLCGRDGSRQFQAQHDTQGEPNEMLAEFKIGTLTS